MTRFLRYHGLQGLTAAVLVALTVWADQRYVFIDNLGVVEPGQLVRCEQPSGDQWRRLKRFGISRVVNLRTVAEGPADFAGGQDFCSRQSWELQHQPITRKLPDLGQIDDFLFAARDPNATVLFHCKHGEDRTGVLAAAYRVVVQNWTVRKAMAEMRRYRCRLDGVKLRLVRRLLLNLRNRRQYWLRRTDPADVWVRRGGPRGNLLLTALPGRTGR
ncbi:MAG: tyrosine-protein phosphatase [Phycisphaerae bacterium]